MLFSRDMIKNLWKLRELAYFSEFSVDTLQMILKLRKKLSFNIKAGTSFSHSQWLANAKSTKENFSFWAKANTKSN